MIQLNYRKARMLTDIGAADLSLATLVSESTDARVDEPGNTHVMAHGHHPDELLPTLKAALVERLSHVPLALLTRDLIVPLRRGLGNAYKRGNQLDAAKLITAELIVTNGGAGVSISDQGGGFDVRETLRKYRAGEPYGVSHGAGFASYEAAGSLVSFAGGGRTLLLRYLHAARTDERAPPIDCPTLGWAGRVYDMTRLLTEALATRRQDGLSFTTCRIELMRPDKKQLSEIHYSLEPAGHGSGAPPKTLTGRLLSRRRATRDFSNAKRLVATLTPDLNSPDPGLAIPEPVAVIPENPHLVLFDFKPAMDLKEYLRTVFDPDEVAAVMHQAATGLRRLHQTHIALDDEEALDDVFAQQAASRTRILTHMADICPDQVNRCRAIFDRLVDPATAPRHALSVTIHGALGWDCILYAEDHFYLFRFDRCRLSHPGFDVAGFLVDLLRFYKLRNRGRAELYAPARNAFLKSYFMGDTLWQNDLGFFMRTTLMQRVERVIRQPISNRAAKVEALLMQCELDLP